LYFWFIFVLFCASIAWKKWLVILNIFRLIFSNEIHFKTVLIHLEDESAKKSFCFETGKKASHEDKKLRLSIFSSASIFLPSVLEKRYGLLYGGKSYVRDKREKYLLLTFEKKVILSQADFTEQAKVNFYLCG
jgi:hypothetical protein